MKCKCKFPYRLVLTIVNSGNIYVNIILSPRTIICLMLRNLAITASKSLVYLIRMHILKTKLIDLVYMPRIRISIACIFNLYVSTYHMGEL